MKKTEKRNKNRNTNWYIPIWAQMLLLVLGIIIITFITHVIHSIEDKNTFWELKWTAGEMLGYLGSIVFGCIAIYQNKKMQEVNDRLLRLEENKHLPGVALFTLSQERLEYLKSNSRHLVVSDKDDLSNSCVPSLNSSYIEAGDNDVIRFELKNVRDIDIIDIAPLSLTQSKLNNNEVVEEKSFELARGEGSFSIKSGESLVFFLGLKDIWKSDEYNFNLLKYDIHFYIITADGNKYQQDISIKIINDDERHLINPIIIRQSIAPAVECDDKKIYIKYIELQK